MSHSFITAKMKVTHQDELFGKLRAVWFFIELNMLFLIMISKQRGQRRRRKPQNPWVMPWILQREETGYYGTLLDELITTDIPGYRNFIRMPPAFFDLIKERIHNRLKKSHTNFRKPMELDLKLAVTLRH